jgi:hypothetical protein
MSKPRKTFRVTFTDTRYMRIDLEARSPSAAIKAAELLYIEGDPDEARFVDFGGEAFQDAEAEEVRS